MHTQNASDNSTDVSTIRPVFLLIQRGLDFMRQGQDSKGIALFELAREQLTPDQEALASLLDMFIQGHKEYLHAQYAHQQASLYFARAHAEHQARSAIFETRLLELLPEAPSQQYPLPLPGEYPSTEFHASPVPAIENTNHHLPALLVHCFGRFEVRHEDNADQPIMLCSNRNGQAILRYLLAQSGYRAPIDKLLEACWSRDEGLEAQHKLRVAISALRRSLNNGHSTHYGGGYILCKAQFYQINPAVTVKTDVATFQALYQAGRESRGQDAIKRFEEACSLYTGPFLVEDLYADWSFVQRTQFSNIHTTMCRVLSDHYLQHDCYEAAIKWATKILQDNHCDEYAHRQIMSAYSYQGKRDEVLRQYQFCERVLQEELGMPPTPETTMLFQKALRDDLLPYSTHENFARTSLELL